MPISAAQVADAAARWKLSDVVSGHTEPLAAYGNLLLRWNASLSLTAIHDEAELIERHLMEGAFAAKHHPPAQTALDFGSGTGIPGIPIAICLRNIQMTLAESRRKKAAFLQEVLRLCGVAASVYAGRAETLPKESFDAVWMRAVERSASMVTAAAALAGRGGNLCFFGKTETPNVVSSRTWEWKSVPLPSSYARVLHIGSRI